MRILFLLKFILITFCGLSQNLTGDYYGKFDTGFIIVDTIDGGFVGQIEFDSVKLSLKRNGKFTISYSYWRLCAAVTNFKRYCSGNYELKNDTLILNSKYSTKSYFLSEESFTKKLLQDSILIVFNPSKQIHLTGPKLRLVIDSKNIGNYSIGDSVMVSKDASEIKFSYECLYNMDWIVNIKDREINNTLALKLKSNIKGENIGIDNMKLLISGNKLLIIENFHFIEIKDNILIKENQKLFFKKLRKRKKL